MEKNSIFKNKNLFLIPAIFILLFFSQTSFACPYCNFKLFNELLTSRAGTLASQELLNTIRNQTERNYTNENIAALLNPESILPPGSSGPQGEQKEFIEIINRDNSLSIPPTSYVPQNTVPNKKVSIELYEGEVYIGEGVMYKGFVTNGTIPGPTIVLDEGDIVEFTVINKGKYPHGASIHAAYVGTSKYLGKIEPGETKSMIFKVTVPGVYLYHCAPGGHAIPMHIIFGQYGMIVVKPKKKYKLEEMLNKPPDVEIYLNQQEFYSSGKDAIDSKPLYVTFNGKLFRYVEDPIRAKPGDYVRIYFLNSGPNLISTFHIVGIIWDFAYWQGNPDVVFPGGQTVTAGPSDSWVVEFRIPPDEGSYYTMLSHAVGSTDRGALGVIICDDSARTPIVISGEGPKYSEQEMTDIKSKVTRIVSPFEPGTPDVDPPQVYGPEAKEVIVKIIGNSYYPKVIEISEGTTVKWINEDIFTYQQGEFGGIHNVVSYEGGPEPFSSNLLTHTQSFSHTFEKEGEYKYMCTPHPYMKGVVIVNTGSYSAGTSKLTMGFMFTILGLVIVTLIFNVWDRKTRK
jgi:nitrite reductase (NO-forming)